MIDIVYPGIRHYIFNFFKKNQKYFNKETIIEKSHDYKNKFFATIIYDDFIHTGDLTKFLNPVFAKWGYINVFYTKKEANLVFKFCFLMDKASDESPSELYQNDLDIDYYIDDSKLIKHRLFEKLINAFNECYQELQSNNVKYDFDTEEDYYTGPTYTKEEAHIKNFEKGIIYDTSDFPCPMIWRRRDVGRWYEDIFIDLEL